MSILDKAAAAVSGDRQRYYGHPLDNHTRTARLWSVYLYGVDNLITPEQVCFLNILQKIARGMHDITEDTLVDIAGFAENIERVRTEKARRLAQGVQEVQSEQRESADLSSMGGA